MQVPHFLDSKVTANFTNPSSLAHNDGVIFAESSSFSCPSVSVFTIRLNLIKNVRELGWMLLNVSFCSFL